MSSEPVFTSFNELAACHEVLTDLFVRHQEAVLALDLPRARVLLERFREAFVRHVEAEETIILPVYGGRVGPVPGGSVEIFEAEHRKMRQMLDSLTVDIERLAPVARDVLAFLDREFTFRHLVEHHDKREENLLYRWMDRITTSDERAVLIARFVERNGVMH